MTRGRRARLDRLSRRGWARLTSGPSSGVAKFRHLLDEALQLTPSQLALLAVLMLRGPQTVGELRTRSERLYPFPSAEDVELALLELADRELTERLPRRPGEREERWTQLLGGHSSSTGLPSPSDVAAPGRELPEREVDRPCLEERVARLERQFAELLERVDQLPGG
jgi:uncharacterized protein